LLQSQFFLLYYKNQRGQHNGTLGFAQRLPVNSTVTGSGAKNKRGGGVTKIQGDAEKKVARPQ
jgi:hypothetical protein